MQNDEMQEQKFKKEVILSEVPLGECSAAMGFQVCFKSVGFFLIFKGNSIFDPPWTEFCGIRHITFIVFFKAGFQVFGTADVEMGFCCFINKGINVMKVGHKRKSFRITFGIMLCRIARLHLLCRLRRGSLPRWVRSPAPMACRGEISAEPR